MHLTAPSVIRCGSSPLARGTRIEMDQVDLDDRFIPARAGNTWPSPAAVQIHPVHPRSRGEHRLTTRPDPPGYGSSPLARGTRGGEAGGGGGVRFIPARAGNTHPFQQIQEDRPVHPRSRGEHQYLAQLKAWPTGSSPLARGTHWMPTVGQWASRFIPARAGNTVAPSPKRPYDPVHPRSRGEHPLSIFAVRSSRGSSPLARGTPERLVDFAIRTRFIPARAGNTSSRWARTAGSSVHPRSRGEHCRHLLHISRLGGSSPLARGTRPFSSCNVCPRRFIPARAGNTSVS